MLTHVKEDSKVNLVCPGTEEAQSTLAPTLRNLFQIFPSANHVKHSSSCFLGSLHIRKISSLNIGQVPFHFVNTFVSFKDSSGCFTKHPEQ